MDDYTGGGNDTSEVFRKQQQIVKIMKDGEFTLHKWKSNDEDLLRLMSQHDATGVESKILGIHWLPKADVMKMGFALEMSKDPVTKRIVLSTLASIYDPLGVIGPVIMKARLIFQKLYLKGKDWDDPLEEEDLKVWNKWVLELKEAKKIEFKRLVLPWETSNDLKMTMHTFCDASEKGYCTTVYLVVDSEKEVTSNLLTAKCRLAPLKKLTIPRLKLTSAKTGSTITKVVQNALQNWDLGETHIWMDSLTELYWLQNKGVWKPFVNNRVKETL